jgi:hypothetical protein
VFLWSLPSFYWLVAPGRNYLTTKVGQANVGP